MLPRHDDKQRGQGGVCPKNRSRASFTPCVPASTARTRGNRLIRPLHYNACNIRARSLSEQSVLQRAPVGSHPLAFTAPFAGRRREVFMTLSDRPMMTRWSWMHLPATRMEEYAAAGQWSANFVDMRRVAFTEVAGQQHSGHGRSRPMSQPGSVSTGT